MLANPYQKYQQSSVQTATPAKLLLMLYDGAIRFVKQGIEGIETKDYATANEALIKAQKIIHEFTASLKLEYPISHNLARIYEYMLHRLIEANTKKSKEPADEVLAYLTELKQTWSEAAKNTTSSQADYG